MSRKPLSPLGIAIQWRIDAKGWSAAELARQAKITPSNLNKYMRGKQAPGMSTLIRISTALDVKPADLLGGETPPPETEALLETIGSQQERIRELESAANRLRETISDLRLELAERDATLQRLTKTPPTPRELKEKGPELKQNQRADLNDPLAEAVAALPEDDPARRSIEAVLKARGMVKGKKPVK